MKTYIKQLSHKHADARWKAAEALGESGDVTAVKPLIKKLSDPSVDVRCSAAEALGKLGDARAFKPLIKRLQKERPDDIHSVYKTGIWEIILSALDKLVNVEVIGLLINNLSDANMHWSFRIWAIGVLGKLGDEQAIEPLIQMLAQPSPRVCNEAEKALIMLGLSKERLIDEYEKMLQKNHSESIHQHVAQRFSELSAPLQHLDGLNLSDPEQRKNALVQLSRYKGYQSFIEPVIDKMFDDDAGVRIQAIQTLGKLGDMGAVQALTEVLDDKDEDIRKAAKIALEGIKKESF